MLITAYPLTIILAVLHTFTLDDVLAVTFTDCGSETGSVLGVHVQDCSTADTSCQIRTQIVRFGINFTTDDGIYNSVTSIGTAKKWGMHAQIFSNVDICNNSLSCPLQPDKHFYAEDVTVPGWVPKGKAYVQWKLSSGSIDILCAEVQVTVI